MCFVLINIGEVSDCGEIVKLILNVGVGVDTVQQKNNEGRHDY